ncbi:MULTISPECIES: hypothetical protein [Robertmurraya]|uniref:NADH dehydrogenase subunit 4 n=1 Tax=Robertmurraya beringensis TaxID=641660 RepID=A0ABV6KKH7_9BACI|nr:Uncharacterised protein [Mycobacteroides abscessus subsp. abscessus]
MKPFLIITQVLYVLSLLPWFVIWGMSFMSFDAGIGLYNSLFVITITLYPVAVIVGSILSWVFHRKRKNLAVIFNLVPLVWVIAFAVFMLWV